MSMIGSACGGSCETCRYSGGGCIAGHNDDYYVPATLEELVMIQL